MIHATRLTVLRRCRDCVYEDMTDKLVCLNCGGPMLTIVYSGLTGARITSTFAQDKHRKPVTPRETQ